MNVITIFITTFLATMVWTYSVQDESDLQEDLLTGYNANVRPADQIELWCNLNIRNLLSLDIVEQALTVSGSLAVVWNDTRLSWNETQNGNVTNVYFKADQIWRPTLVLQNTATGIEVIGDDSNQKSIPLRVNPFGRVLWRGPAYFISYCSVDVSKFPFDTQTCEIKISGWMYTTDTVKFIHKYDHVRMTQFEKNGEYDVIRTYTRVDSHELHESYIETLVFGVELRRKYSYYLLNIVLPVLFTQLLGLVVFMVPVESGEKLTFSITLLLSLTVMMTLVAEKIPTTSLQIPTLSIYMLGGTVISGLELIMTVVILHFKHYDEKSVRMSRRLQILAYVLSLLTCKKRNQIESELDETGRESTKYNGVITVEDLASEGYVNEEKGDITSVSQKNFDQNDDLIYSYRFSSEEISAMIEQFSLVFFSIITLLFTFALLMMIM